MNPNPDPNPDPTPTPTPNPTLIRQQQLVVSEDEVEDEMMTLQAQALQRGEKFKPSEVKPNVEA